ncbi:MAG: BON domain-containing protein [Bradyrhizobium sp.]
MTDQALKQTVLDELVWDPSVNEAHVGVTARGGVVTLTGICTRTETAMRTSQSRQ